MTTKVTLNAEQLLQYETVMHYQREAESYQHQCIGYENSGSHASAAGSARRRDAAEDLRDRALASKDSSEEVRAAYHMVMQLRLAQRDVLFTELNALETTNERKQELRNQIAVQHILYKPREEQAV